MKILLKVIPCSLRYLFLTFIAVISFFPIYWLLTVALKTRVDFLGNIFGLPSKLYFGNFLNLIHDPALITFFANSAIITTSTIIIVMVVGTLSGYVLARFDFIGRDIILLILLLAQLVPLTVIVIPLYSSLKSLSLLGDRSYYGLIGSMVALNLGVACLLSRGFFRTISTEILEAARLDGCEEIQAFWYIAFPLARPGLIVLLVILFINVWNEYFLTMVIIPDSSKYTLSLGLMYYQGQFQTFYPQLATAIIIATIPAIALYTFFQEQVIKGVGASARTIKG